MRKINAFMLRISRIEPNESTIALRLEGQIVGPWVDELRRATEGFRGNGHTFAINLAEVTFADRDGVALLSRLRSHGVALVDCSPFVEAQLKV